MRLLSSRPIRLTMAGAGVLVLTGISTAAMADEDYGSDDIDINVEIAELEEPGVLAMSVAGDSVSLDEDGSTELVRQFTGELPTVTVTDTRSEDEIPEEAAWAVVGSASDFEASDGDGLIEAKYLGWQPRLIDGGDSGMVSEGDEVESVVDDGPGFGEEELLTMAFDSSMVREEGQWTVSADLFLRTEATVDPGNYSSTLTLSLFE